jgi:hypothetical protein
MSDKAAAKADILRSLNPLIDQAEADGLWLHCAYQDLWFSPQELRDLNAKDQFLWGSVNWTPRPPSVHLAQLKQALKNAGEAYESFRLRAGL